MSAAFGLRTVAVAVVALLVLSACGVLEPADQVATGSEAEVASATPGDETTEGEPAAQDQAGDPEPAASTDDQQETVEPTSTTATTAPPVIDMPDLVGMTETEARAVLNGLGAAEPAVSTQESFDPPGTVLDQVPTAGKVLTGAVNLVVAVSIAPMPDFAGVKIAEVREWTEARGIELRTETTLTDAAAAGEILGQIPDAGAQVGQEIVVTVADAAVTVDLVDFGRLDGNSTYTDDIEMNGSTFPKTTYMAWSSSRRTAWASYNLSRDWSTLKMSVGVSDEHSSAALAQVEIKGDDEVLHTETVGFGTLEDIEVDVTGVLRMTIIVTPVEGSSSRLGLGNARLIGGAGSGG